MSSKKARSAPHEARDFAKRHSLVWCQDALRVSVALWFVVIQMYEGLTVVGGNESPAEQRISLDCVATRQ
ncbi:MAG: hypothetical protein NVSMB1_01270 [Polyangiales bacterium]